MAVFHWHGYTVKGKSVRQGLKDLEVLAQQYIPEHNLAQGKYIIRKIV